MLRDELAQTLKQLSLLMELAGDNPFKIKAHQNAVRIIETFEGDLNEAIQSGKIGDVKGIGPALKEKITEFAKTGQIKEYENLKNQTPSGLLDMLSISGMGPKKVKAIYEELGVDSLGALELACKRNRLAELKGFGLKSQNQILQALEFKKKLRNKFLYSDAVLEAQIIRGVLLGKGLTKDLEICGSIRRKKEIVGNINLVASSSKLSTVLDAFQSLPTVEMLVSRTNNSARVQLKNGLHCELQVVSQEEFPFALLYWTGSKDHNEALKKLAQEKGLELTSKSISAKSEAEIYGKLGLSYIEPELREGTKELQEAKANRLPILVLLENIRGVFHCHTTDSDGINTLEEMVSAAQEKGYDYIGISDHSMASASYANGLVKERVLAQFKKIEEIQKNFRIKIFRGIEADILADGELDYDPEFLLKFDFVIGSLHNALRQEESKMTARVEKAIKNPLMDIFGHPTARILLSRPEAQFNVQKMINLAVQNNVVVELNANPQRLDLDWRYGSYLAEKGGLVSINPDAHSVAGLDDVEFGINVARKGWLSSKNIINTLPAKDVLKSLKGHRLRN